MTARQWVAHAGIDPRHQESGTSLRKACPHLPDRQPPSTRGASTCPPWSPYSGTDMSKPSTISSWRAEKAPMQANVAVMRKAPSCYARPCSARRRPSRVKNSDSSRLLGLDGEKRVSVLPPVPTHHPAPGGRKPFVEGPLEQARRPAVRSLPLEGGVEGGMGEEQEGGSSAAQAALVPEQQEHHHRQDNKRRAPALPKGGLGLFFFAPSSGLPAWPPRQAGGRAPDPLDLREEPQAGASPPGGGGSPRRWGDVSK